MTHVRRGAFVLVLGFAMVPPPAQAQNDFDFVAYRALVSTPVGGFVPLPTGALVAGALPTPPRGRASVRYGHAAFQDDSGAHNVGATAHFITLGGAFGLTGGARFGDSTDPVILIGFDWSVALSRTSFSDATLVIALAPAVGVGILTSGNANGGFLSGALGAPFTLIAGRDGGVRVIPYLMPALGIGTATADVDVGGARAMLGGGLEIVSAGGVGVSAGFQKMFIEGRDTIIGLAISLGR